MQGLRILGHDLVYRKELVAGNLGEYITSRILIYHAQQHRFDASRDQNFSNPLSVSATMRVSSMSPVESISSRVV
jgi:hypothetical protein